VRPWPRTTAVAWARENAKLSGLENAPIRWITEDALKFVKREISRGAKYDAIVMDPPAFGHGPKNELWKIEEDFVAMVKLCQIERQILRADAKACFELGCRLVPRSVVLIATADRFGLSPFFRCRGGYPRRLRLIRSDEIKVVLGDFRCCHS
jgi:23S rRNA G2069 N7-methylase RlmK/C1962 C5-methylase RlmI